MAQSPTRSELVALSAKIIAEMNRRNGYGSLTSFGESADEITTAPAAGSAITAD